MKCNQSENFAKLDVKDNELCPMFKGVDAPMKLTISYFK